MTFCSWSTGGGEDITLKFRFSIGSASGMCEIVITYQVVGIQVKYGLNQSKSITNIGKLNENLSVLEVKVRT